MKSFCNCYINLKKKYNYYLEITLLTLSCFFIIHRGVEMLYSKHFSHIYRY